MRRGLLPRLQDLLFIVLLVGALVSGSRMLNTDSDLGRHLTLGGFILSSHRIPTTDILSSTKSGAPRPPYEWLAQVLLAFAYRILNLDGVVLLTSIVIAAAFSLVYLDCVHRSAAPILALLLSAWAAVASSLHWLPRPHIFSFLFLAAWLSLLERLRRREAVSLWLFPLLMLVWANTHGGFIFGFLAFGVYFVGWLFEKLRGSADSLLGRIMLIAGATSLAASVLTPDLWNNWEAVLNNRSSYILSRTIETMPLNATTPGVWPFLALLLLAVVLLAARRFRVPAAHVILLAVLAAASFAMVRNIPLFAIAAAPIICEWAAASLERIRIWRHVENRFAELEANFIRYAWSCLALLTVIGMFAWRSATTDTPLFQFRVDVFPVRAADWALAHTRSGRMFNDFNWGGYLLFRLWPEQRVFIDSQSDFYGESLTREAASVAAGESGWEAALDEYRVDWMLIPRAAGLAHAALASPNWSVAYQDDVAIILVRK